MDDFYAGAVAWFCSGVDTRLDILKAGRIQANAAYADFKAWCEAEVIAPCSLQMFERRFTRVVESMT